MNDNDRGKVIVGVIFLGSNYTSAKVLSFASSEINQRLPSNVI